MSCCHVILFHLPCHTLNVCWKQLQENVQKVSPVEFGGSGWSYFRSVTRIFEVKWSDMRFVSVLPQGKKKKKVMSDDHDGRGRSPLIIRMRRQTRNANYIQHLLVLLLQQRRWGRRYGSRVLRTPAVTSTLKDEFESLHSCDKHYWLGADNGRKIENMSL